MDLAGARPGIDLIRLGSYGLAKESSRTERGFVVKVPDVKKRDPRTDAEREQPWTYCHMEPGAGWWALDAPGDELF